MYFSGVLNRRAGRNKCACIKHGDYSREEICTVFARNNFVKIPNCVLRTIAIAAKD